MSSVEGYEVLCVKNIKNVTCWGGYILKPRITVITLGVDDVEKALHFYRDGLGLPSDGIVGEEFEHGAVAFSTYSRALSSPFGTGRILHMIRTLTRQCQARPNSRSDIMLEAKQKSTKSCNRQRQAGAVITVPPYDTFWGGYSGYFQDPDGHLWEVVWNPQWEIE